jgi:CRISPR-associated protein Cmr3
MCNIFKYLITLSPLGLLYGSTGSFLSAENLVGRSQAKFPPDSGAFSGLLLNAARSEKISVNKQELTVAGPFWMLEEMVNYLDFFVPIPWTKIISDNGWDAWILNDKTEKDQRPWKRQSDPDKEKANLEPDYAWQRLSDWDYLRDKDRSAEALYKKLKSISQIPWVSKDPWTFVPNLHPYMQDAERCVQEKGGLFLEQAVLMDEDTRLVYLSTEPIVNGCYKFGGENHLVEVECFNIDENHNINKLLHKPIDQSFALITPAIWGSNRRSLRHPKGMKVKALLTDKPTTFRFRSGGQAEEPDLNKRKSCPGRLGRGRYAVKAGSVYVLEKALEDQDNWWNWEKKSWFPHEGFSLQRLGCGLALPIKLPVKA